MSLLRRVDFDVSNSSSFPKYLGLHINGMQDFSSTNIRYKIKNLQLKRSLIAMTRIIRQKIRSSLRLENFRYDNGFISVRRQIITSTFNHKVKESQRHIITLTKNHIDN